MVLAEDDNNGVQPEDDSSDEDERAPAGARPSSMPAGSSAQAAGGRVRRWAVFGQQALEEHSSSDESDEEGEEAAMPRALGGRAARGAAGDAGDSDGSGDSEGKFAFTQLQSSSLSYLGAVAGYYASLLRVLHRPLYIIIKNTEDSTCDACEI